MNPLLTVSSVDEHPRTFLESCGRIGALYDHRTQDSGNISYEMQTAAGRFLVKTAGELEDLEPRLGHAERVALLRNAAALRSAVDHELLPELHNVIESPRGPLLVWQWVPGELLSTRTAARDDSSSVIAFIARSPPALATSLLERVLDLHVQIVEQGWIAGDLYDGSMLFERGSDRLHLIDLDGYHRGPTINTMGRMFGSSRWMAPEEFQLGAAIDECTTVFLLGRIIEHLLGDGTGAEGTFRGSARQWQAASTATRHDPSKRFAAVRELREAFID